MTSDAELTPGAPTDEPARERLRRETAAAHQALEALPGMRRLLDADVSRADYAAVLGAFLAVHQVLEARAAHRAGWTPGTSAVRLRALRADLEDLGPLAPPTAAAPPAPEFAEPAEALGACYVLEGSFLGAVVIAAHLRRCLGVSLPLRYFGAEGIETSRRWEAFLALLEDQLATPSERDRAVQGARRCYAWLQRVLP